MFFIRAVSVPIMVLMAHAVPIKNREMTATRKKIPARWFFSAKVLRSTNTFKFLPTLNQVQILNSLRAIGFGLHLNMILLVPGIPQQLFKF